MEIRVSDTGTGIDTSCQARLFEPFFTGFDVSHHSSGHYEFGRRGLGLGLSIARAFIEMHGGSISCRSETGKGSTFTITLPAVRRRETWIFRFRKMSCSESNTFASVADGVQPHEGLMTARPSPRWTAALLAFAWCATGTVFAMGLANLLGWARSVEILKNLRTSSRRP